MTLTIKKAKKAINQTKIFLIAYFGISAIFSLIFSIYGVLFYIIHLLFDLGLMYTYIQRKVEIKVYGLWANVIQFALSIIAIIAIGLFTWWQIIFLVIDVFALFANWKHCEAAKYLTPIDDSGHSDPRDDYGRTDEEHQLGNFSLNHPLSNASLVDQFRLNKKEEGSKEKSATVESDSGTHFTDSTYPSIDRTTNKI